MTKYEAKVRGTVIKNPPSPFRGCLIFFKGQVSSSHDVSTNHQVQRTNQSPASGLKKVVPAFSNANSKSKAKNPMTVKRRIPFAGCLVLANGHVSNQKI